MRPPGLLGDSDPAPGLATPGVLGEVLGVKLGESLGEVLGLSLGLVLR
jgi:hypothetical protein